MRAAKPPTKTASIRNMFARNHATTIAPVGAGRATSDRRQAGEGGRVSQRSETRGELDGDCPGPPGASLSSASWRRLCHDLRTPLNAILGNAELLLDGSAGPLSSQARACVGDIQTAGSRLMRQIQVLLELCRIRAAPAPAALELDLLLLLRTAPVAAQGGPGLQVAPPGARLVVRGDPAWLGTLAAMLIELRPADGQSSAPSLVDLESPACRGAGVTIRVLWADFRPDQVAELPLALIDAILDLHNGTTALSGDGLRLYWLAARLVHLEPAALLLAHDPQSE